MEVRKLVAAEPRVESGAIQFGRDWPGLFIRGDEAVSYAHQLAHALLRLDSKDQYEKILLDDLKGLVELLVSCNESNRKDGRAV